MKLTNTYFYGIAILYRITGFLSLFVKMFIMNDSVAVYGIHRLLFIGLVSQHLRLTNFVTKGLRSEYKHNAVCIPETFTGVQLHTKCLRFVNYELLSLKSRLILYLMNWPIFINLRKNDTPNSKPWLPAFSDNIMDQQSGRVAAKLRTSNEVSSNYTRQSVDSRKIRNFVQQTLPQTAEQHGM